MPTISQIRMRGFFLQDWGGLTLLPINSPLHRILQRIRSLHGRCEISPFFYLQCSSDIFPSPFGWTVTQTPNPYAQNLCPNLYSIFQALNHSLKASSLMTAFAVFGHQKFLVLFWSSPIFSEDHKASFLMLHFICNVFFGGNKFLLFPAKVWTVGFGGSMLVQSVFSSGLLVVKYFLSNN